jgi:succinoglycan biosynthesis transport protein ExoP
LTKELEVRGGREIEPRHSLATRIDSAGPPPEDRLDLRAIYFALRRQRLVILITMAVFLVAATIFTLLQAPKFSASTRVVLNTSDDRVAPKADNDPSTTPPSSDIVDTEVEVIRSRELALVVAHSLKLDRDPAFNPLLNPHEGHLHRIERALGLAQPQPQTVSPDTTERVIVAKLLGGLTVTRVGLTYAFNIVMTLPNAHSAQAIANEYAYQYTQLYLTRKRASDAASVGFLGHRLEDLRAQAQADTARAQQYRIANNLLSTSGASLTEQEISNYDQGVATARAQAVEDQARLDTARAQLRGGSKGDDVGEALGSSVVSGLRAKRSEVSGRLASLEAHYGPLYPDVQRAKSELADVDAQISAEIGRIISNLEAKVRVSSDRLASIQGSLGSARGQLTANNRAMVGLDDLNRRAEASQQLYDSYLAQYKQTSAGEGTERPAARVISYAELPLYPVSPKPALNILLALVLGAGVGAAIALIREMLYSGLTTAADVESRFGVRCLGSIPLLKSILPSATSPIVAIVEQPQSGFAEAFRGLRSAIKFAAGGPRQVILITSALPREGKTTVSACLARMAALNGENVVLVDVDARQRGTSRLLRGNEGRPGLIELLRGEVSLDEALIQDGMTGTWLLPIQAGAGDVGDLLIGEQMDLLIAQLRQRFSLILLDAPPVLAIADTRSLVAKVDTVVMVARWRSTADHAVRTALRLLPSNHVEIAGIVLSQVNIRKQSRYGYGDGELYYEKYKHYYA